jgi:hypothetical protein
MKTILYLLSSILFLVAATSPAALPIDTVIVVVMENKNWSDINGSSSAPYINNTLLPIASYCRNYRYDGVHPSLPNYLTMECGRTMGVHDDKPPSSHHFNVDHLSAQLEAAGLDWRCWAEGIPGNTCPTRSSNGYAPKHDPFVYFDDVYLGTPRCIEHIRPYTELQGALNDDTLANYNFVVPKSGDNMHATSTQDTIAKQVKAGDNWLKAEIPKILSSPRYLAGRTALIITWDEGRGGDGPIGCIVISPAAKGGGYSNAIHYTHCSLLRTVQEIFAVGPLLGGAASATNLGDLFQ